VDNCYLIWIKLHEVELWQNLMVLVVGTIGVVTEMTMVDDDGPDDGGVVYLIRY
jgi:hypothetical protein